ncbi:MAG: hypothetical protein IV097_10870 [Burkholderiaceae bacterium]|nr:hypothetical protein [Burkholderiaceae bacterium]
MQANCPTQTPRPPSPPLYTQRAQQDVFVPMPPLNAGTFAAAVAVTSFLAMVTVLA